MNKFKLFLKQSNFKDDLLSAKLEKVLVNELEKSWHFHISFKRRHHLIVMMSFRKIKLYFTITGTVDKF